jgi:hypothetical protein
VSRCATSVRTVPLSTTPVPEDTAVGLATVPRNWTALVTAWAAAGVIETDRISSAKSIDQQNPRTLRLNIVLPFSAASRRAHR